MAKSLSDRPGKVGKEVRAAVKELGELTGLQRIEAAMIERTADAVDAAYRSDDPRLLLAAMRDLRGALSRLGASGDDAGAPGADDVGEPEPEPDPMAGVLGAGPEVGDAADA